MKVESFRHVARHSNAHELFRCRYRQDHMHNCCFKNSFTTLSDLHGSISFLWQVKSTLEILIRSILRYRAHRQDICTKKKRKRKR